MTRIRLRESRSPEDERAYYAGVYPHGYRHDVWPDHVERVGASAKLIGRYKNNIRSAADLSCGDAAILRGLASFLDKAYLGDLNGVPEYRGRELVQAGLKTVQYVPGPLPGSLATLPQPVDLFVLSETLEHMDDPDALLRGLTACSRYLFVSTPVDEIDTSGNLEHYWSWGTADIGQMLRDAGWDALELEVLTPQTTRHLEHAYRYQMWMAVSRP